MRELPVIRIGAGCVIRVQLEAGYHQQRGAVLALGCEHYAASTDTYPGRGVARQRNEKGTKETSRFKV